MVINNQESRRRPAPPRRRGTKGLPSGSRRNLSNTSSTTEETTRDVTRRRNDTRRVTFDIRPPGLADRRVHLMFVAVRVMLAVLADVIVLTVSLFNGVSDHFGIEMAHLRGDWLLFAAVFNAVAGRVTTYYQKTTSRCASVFVVWLVLRIVWLVISEAVLELPLPPSSFDLQIASMTVGAFGLSQSLYYSDKIWAEDDGDYVIFHAARSRMYISEVY